MPIFVAGGPSTESPLDALKLAEAAMQSGAKGLVFGRKILEAKNPILVTRALRYIVHEGYSAEEAATNVGLLHDENEAERI